MIWTRLSASDKIALVIIFLLSSFGCMMLYSAAGGNPHPWAYKQIMHVLLGFVILYLFASIDVKYWRNYSYIFYTISIFLLILVDIKGHIGMGAQRWIDLYFFKLQPSELMKLSLIMTLSYYFQFKSENETRKISSYYIPVILIVLPALLVLRQPDLGSAIILIASGIIMIFMAGILWWKICIIIGALATSFPILWANMHTYQKKRVLNFLNPEQDPLGSGYHIIQSKIAIGSGAFLGKGFMFGTQSQLSFLPEKHTDFIFAMICEECGFLGGSILILLYTVLLSYSFKICYECRHIYGRLLAAGLSWLLFLYIFINIGMVMGILPAKGVPLPFVSYGGTSIISLMIVFGLLISISLSQRARYNIN